MSYSFDIGQQTVWGPANQVGALYVGMVQVVAETLGVPTGLIEQTEDWFEIDPQRYTALVQAMLSAYADSGHWEKRLLVGSLLAVSIGILDRAGIAVPALTDAERQAAAKLRDVAF